MSDSAELAFSVPTNSRERMHSELEYTVVVVVSPTCGACKDSTFKADWERIRSSVHAQAERSGAEVAYVGVAVTWEVEEGVSFLRELGGIDEILVGSNWLGIGAEEFLYHDFPSRMSVPQVVVVKKRRSVGDGDVQLHGKELLARAIGLREIARWAANGVPL